MELDGARSMRQSDDASGAAADADDALGRARCAIDAIDRKMSALFVERMRAAEQVAAYKGERGLPVHDPQREAELLAREAAFVDDVYRPYYLRFMEAAIAESRRYQQRLLEGARIAYSGVEGAFAWVAAGRAFPGAELCAYPDFRQAYDAVVEGTCECAVLPIENSEAGEVGQVMDLMFNGPLFANRAFGVPIVQNVLGLPGSTLDGIRTVVSHPQALAQCAAYIAQRGWELREAVNTAVAARALLDAGTTSVAAIASAEAAEKFGLVVLDHDQSIPQIPQAL